MCLAVPGKILSVAEDALRTGRVDFGGVVKEISLVMVPEAACGDYVIVHAGVALRVIDEAAARETLTLLAQAAQTQG